jgi:hypothetical protein
MTSTDRPKVSVLVPAHNYQSFVEQSLESALAQDYPAERLEIVVVDDGSTDGTADVVRAVMARNPGRIRFVQQHNQGQLAAIARARAEATGELLAFLDADDEWLPTKVSKQVALFEARPDVALVFCDMTTIDTEGRVLKHSLFDPGEPDMDPVRLYARVLRSNIIYGGSSMYRADLVSDLPAEAESWDWWLSTRATESRALGHLEIGFVPERLALYRQHPDNMLLGASGEKLVALRRRQLRFQLWALRNVSLDPLTAPDLRFVLGGVEWFVRTTQEQAGVGLGELVTVGAEDRVQAQLWGARAEQALTEGALMTAARMQLRAWTWDPHDGPRLARFLEITAQAGSVAQAPHPLRGARAFVVLADAEDLLAGDEMLSSYASAMRGAETVTLAIDATRFPAAEVTPLLEQLLERCQLVERDDIDLLAMVGPLDPDQRHQLAHRIQARYVRSAPDDARGAEPPAFSSAGLAELRGLSDAAGALARPRVTPTGPAATPDG